MLALLETAQAGDRLLVLGVRFYVRVVPCRALWLRLAGDLQCLGEP